MNSRAPAALVLVGLALAGIVPSAQTRTARTSATPPNITSPKSQFGFNIGDDYQLANYAQIAEYWRKLDAESDRLIVQEIGKTAEGRPQLMAIVTSAANQKNLARYKAISQRLALAEGLDDAQARVLAKEGKAVVWIDGGLHATEVLGAQQLAQMVYEMVNRTDEETMRFLDECIILFVHANPDGNDLVADWYMRNRVAERRSLANLPRLYQKYIGHDNNRDFFMSTQAGIRTIAMFDTATPLRSGWAWGQKYLDGGVLALEARVGKGSAILYGPEILHRAQPHGAFKLLFNGIYSSVASR